MSQTVFGAAAVVTILNRAFNNSSPAAAVFNNQVSQVGTTAASEFAFANTFGSSFAGLTDAQLSTRVLGNMGLLPNPDLEQALADYFGSVNPVDRGTVVLQLGQILATLETAPAPQDIFNAAATAWNKEVEQSYIYSSNTSNTTPFDGDFSGTDTFTLTRFTDVKTSANFNGFLDYNQYTGNDEQTLTTGDRLTGTAATTDTLFAQLSGNARPSVTGVEIISIDAKAAAVTLDMSDTHGATQIVNKGSNEAATLNFNNANSLVSVAIENTNSDTVVTFAPSVVAGAADNLSLSLNGAGIAADRANFTATGIESMAINATGAASMMGNINAAGVRTVTITGDQNLSVGTKTAGTGFTSAALATVNAADATGNLFLNVSSTTGVQTITTGTGNDTVVVAGLSALDTFTLGAGTDRVVVTDAGSNQAVKMVGVEQVEARVIGTSLNLTNATDVNLIALAENAGTTSIANVTGVKSGTTFAFEGEGAANAAAAATATFGTTQFNLSNATGATDVINVTFSNSGIQMGAGGAVNIGAMNNSGNNVETLNFNFADVGADDTVTVAGITDTGLKSLNFTSDSKVTLTAALTMTGVTSVDASGVKDAFTANLGTQGAAANVSVLTGGSGNNNVTIIKAVDAAVAAGPGHTALTVNGSAGTGSQTFTVNNLDGDLTSPTTANFVFTGGSGADTLVLTSAAGSLNSISAGAGTDNITITASLGADYLVLNLGDTGATVATGDTVTGFKAAGADMIDLRSFGFDVALQTVQAAGTALNGTAGEFGTSAVAAYTVGGNTTVYIDTNGDAKLGAGDLVVNLIGTAAVVGADIAWA